MLPTIIGTITGLFPAISNVLDRFFPDKEKAAQAAREIESTLIGGILNNANLQIEVNREEAKNPRLFVSGWRPFIGWVCGVALAWQYVALPLMSFVFVYANIPWSPPAITIDGNLWELMLGLLGMAGLRSYEKFKGVAAR